MCVCVNQILSSGRSQCLFCNLFRHFLCILGIGGDVPSVNRGFWDGESTLNELWRPDGFLLLLSAWPITVELSGVASGVACAALAPADWPTECWDVPGSENDLKKSVTWNGDPVAQFGGFGTQTTRADDWCPWLLISPWSQLLLLWRVLGWDVPDAVLLVMDDGDAPSC